jgi:hypothetical protein
MQARQLFHRIAEHLGEALVGFDYSMFLIHDRNAITRQVHQLPTPEFGFAGQCDVMRNPQNPDQAAIRRTHRCLGGFKQATVAAIGVGQPFFVAARLLGDRSGQVVGAEKIGQFGFDEVVIGLADHDSFPLCHTVFQNAGCRPGKRH